MTQPTASLVDLRNERERVIAVITDAYAQDLFGDDELERRLDLAHRAASLAELTALRADLPAPLDEPEVESRALVPAAGAALAERGAVRRVLSVFGNVTRSGGWRPAARMRTTSVFGNAELDFREARLSPGVTEIRVRAVFGSVEIIVPPGLAVETAGTSIFGSFEHVDRAPAFADPEAPLLRVVGSAVFGSVEVKTRLPGESVREAWKRRRLERRRERERRRRERP